MRRVEDFRKVVPDQRIAEIYHCAKKRDGKLGIHLNTANFAFAEKRKGGPGNRLSGPKHRL